MRESLPQAIGIVQRALPHSENTKAVSTKGLIYLSITGHIAGEFRLPESKINFWSSATVATMSVPETSVNKDAPLPSYIRQIGSTVDSLGANAIANAKGMDDASYRQFWGRILLFYGAHARGYGGRWGSRYQISFLINRTVRRNHASSHRMRKSSSRSVFWCSRWLISSRRLSFFFSTSREAWS